MGIEHTILNQSKATLLRWIIQIIDKLWADLQSIAQRCGQFTFQWIYHYHCSKSTEKETGETHLCALVYFSCPNHSLVFNVRLVERWLLIRQSAA